VIGERTIEIAAGTQSDHVIKMKWDGFPSLSRRDSRWDLYIHLQIEIPKKLSKKERELYEAIAHEKGIGWDEEKGFFEKIFCD
jgi:molecular chaperone DnaJ